MQSFEAETNDLWLDNLTWALTVTRDNTRDRDVTSGCVLWQSSTGLPK